MTKEQSGGWSLKDNVVVGLFLALAIYVYVGFYFVDPATFGLHQASEKLVKLIRLLFPFVTIGLIYVYVALRMGEISIRSLRAWLLGSAIFAVLAFWAAGFAYDRSKQENITQFHAYLQVTPPLITKYNKDLFNVVCLGGSTTEWKDEGQRDWPSMVQKELQNKYKLENVQFYNLGKQWYSSQHILTHYIQNVRPYRPQAIIVMENVNDLLQNADFSRMSSGEFRGDYGHFLGPVTKLVKYGGFSGSFFGMLRSIWYQKPLQEVITDSFPGLESFERNLRTLIALARIDGTKVILMTQPNIYKEEMSSAEMMSLTMLNAEAIGYGKKWGYRTALSGFRQYNDKIRAIAASENIPLIDLEKVVPKTLDYFFDDVHYKNQTYDLISGFLAEQLSHILPGTRT